MLSGFRHVFFSVIVLIFFSCRPSHLFNITDFGARGDSIKINTAAIQRAIDMASFSGGGIVVIPKGIFITGTIEMKSNVTLQLLHGAVLYGSSDGREYKTFRHSVKLYPDTMRRYLVYARNASNIAITGDGTINGNGTSFWEPFDTLPRWIKPLKGRVSNMIEFVGCNNIRITDVLFTNSPEWTVHLYNCEKVFISRIRLINNLYGPNNDGIDLSGCKDVMISDSYIETCDDAICLKTFPESAETENICVTNCVMKTTCVAFKMGETYRDIRFVTFSNSVIKESSRAIGIYGNFGGTLENINISNIVCNTNAPLVLNRPVQISVWNDGRGFPPGRVRNVTISNLTAVTQGRIMLTAIPGYPLENITLRDIRIVYPYIEDPSVFGVNATSNQFAAMDMKQRLAPSACVASNINNLLISNLQVVWPDDTIPAIWKHPVRIENGSDRVHKPVYRVPRETGFSVFWGRRINNGKVEIVNTVPSDPKMSLTVVKESNLKIVAN